MRNSLGREKSMSISRPVAWENVGMGLWEERSWRRWGLVSLSSGSLWCYGLALETRLIEIRLCDEEKMGRRLKVFVHGIYTFLAQSLWEKGVGGLSLSPVPERQV